MTILKFILLGCLLLLFACAGNEKLINGTNGNYKYHIVKGGHFNMPIIKGQLYDMENNSPLSINGAIKIDNKIMARTNSSGKYLFSVKPGSYRITGTGFPYKFLETKNILISTGDTLNLDMFLKSDTRTVN